MLSSSARFSISPCAEPPLRILPRDTIVPKVYRLQSTFRLPHLHRTDSMSYPPQHDETRRSSDLRCAADQIGLVPWAHLVRVTARGILYRVLFIMAIGQTFSAAGCQFLRRSGPSEAELANARQLSQRGLAAMDQGNWEQAENLLAGALEESPDDWQMRAYYAEALWRRGESQRSIEQLAALPNLRAPDATSAVRIGGLLLEMNEPELARRLADLALDMNPQSSAAWALRGRTWLKVGDFDQALADLNRALDYDPNNQSVLLDVAELHRANNRPERALSTLQYWINLYPPGEEPQQALYLQGLAYEALQRPRDSVASIAAAVARGNPTAQMLYELANAENRAGDAESARRSLRQALDLDSAHRPSLALLQQLDLGSEVGRGTIFQ